MYVYELLKQDISKNGRRSIARSLIFNYCFRKRRTITSTTLNTKIQSKTFKN